MNFNVSLRAENTNLKEANEIFENRLAAIEHDNDSLEQYTRRNSLRISGIPEDRDENTDQEVMRIAGQLGVDVGRFDIDRSHRVGSFDDHRRPGAKRRSTRDVIVKFATYNVRNRVYQERKELRNTTTLKSVFINEDLTKKRSKLMFEARTLARADLLKAAYSSDGRIFVIDNDDTRHLIKSNADIKSFGDVEEAKKVVERKRELRRPTGVMGSVDRLTVSSVMGAMGSGLPLSEPSTSEGAARK